MIASCPSCSHSLHYSGSDVGQLYTCSQCGQINEFPRGAFIPSTISPITSAASSVSISQRPASVMSITFRALIALAAFVLLSLAFFAFLIWIA